MGAVTEHAVLIVGGGPTGLMLAGDAAHVHSPVGGQGLNLSLIHI